MNPQVLSAPGRPRLMHDVVPPYASILAKTKAQPIEPAPQMEAQVVEQVPAVPEAHTQAVEAAPVVETVRLTTEMPVEPTAHPAFTDTPVAPVEVAQAEVIAPTPVVKAASSKSHVVAITIALLVSAALLAAAYYAFSQRGL